MADKTKGNFFYTNDSDESNEETVDNQKSTTSGELPDKEDVNQTKQGGVKNVPRGPVSSGPSGVSVPASSELT